MTAMQELIEFMHNRIKDSNKLLEQRTLAGMISVIEHSYLEKEKQMIKRMYSDSYIVNGFKITQTKNLHPSILSWQAKHLYKDIVFVGKTKKECINWCENYNYAKD